MRAHARHPAACRPTGAAAPVGVVPRGSGRRQRTVCIVPRATAAPQAAVPPPDLLSPSAPAPGTERPRSENQPGVLEGTWVWTPPGRPGAPPLAVRYTRAAANDDDAARNAPPVVCVHGFGGNADHWRKNVVPLSETGLRVWAVDLVGYGYSSKPDPRTFAGGSPYTFDVWGAQLVDFIAQVVGEPAFLTTNSVGGIAALAAAAASPASVRGVQLMDVSLRMLHTSKQAPWQRPLVAALQRFLRETAAGEAFFGTVATRATVGSILKKCYGNPAAVTDDLVSAILEPGLEPGAARVFLDFISYSGGPLAEDMLASPPLSTGAVPVSVLWGEADPWEKVEWGRAAFTPTTCPGVIEEFVPLPGVGHCPQDEAPEVVNPLIARFVRRHS